MPIAYLSQWAPFKIDALGLVTLVGADEVNKSVGRLVQSRYTKFLPLLGGYIIAGNKFTSMASGYHLYNISDAIATTSLSAWLTRWLSSQELKMSTTVIEWSVSAQKENTKNRRPYIGTIIPATIGFVPVSSLVVISVLMYDWWAFSNAVSMGLSVLVRWYMVKENLQSLDEAATTACYGQKDISGDNNRVKLLIALADGRMVTMYAPRGLVTEGFTKKVKVHQPHLYSLAQYTGWLLFGIHIISLGQSALLSQIATVLLLVFCTWITVRGLGCEEYEIGNYITVQQFQNFPATPDRKLQAYVRLECNETEEDTLADWGLLPRKVNEKWWRTFRETQSKWRAERPTVTHSTAKV
jgi:hypothetical protein